MPALRALRRAGRVRVPGIDVEIAPEPTEAERAVLGAFVSGDEEATAAASQSSWARAALEDGIAADDGYGSAPPL